jgi:hypothetical protein
MWAPRRHASNIEAPRLGGSNVSLAIHVDRIGRPYGRSRPDGGQSENSRTRSMVRTLDGNPSSANVPAGSPWRRKRRRRSRCRVRASCQACGCTAPHQASRCAHALGVAGAWLRRRRHRHPWCGLRQRAWRASSRLPTAGWRRTMFVPRYLGLRFRLYRDVHVQTRRHMGAVRCIVPDQGQRSWGHPQWCWRCTGRAGRAVGRSQTDPLPLDGLEVVEHVEIGTGSPTRTMISAGPTGRSLGNLAT